MLFEYAGSSSISSSSHAAAVWKPAHAVGCTADNECTTDEQPSFCAE